MIYLAGPLFSEMERDYIEKVVTTICRKLNLDSLEDFYIPHLDNKEISDTYMYDKNIENLNNCDLMIAILDGKDIDSGTAFEIGYFEAQGKIVLGLLTDTRSYEDNGVDFNKKLNTMIYGSCDYGELVFNDIDYLIDELYDIIRSDYN